jgi:AraC family transcriptional regulator
LLRDVRDLIAAHYTEPLDLADLAALLGIDSVHVARAFRQHYGCTVGDRIRELRIERAKTRIAAKMPLSEVALDAGFADQSHFTHTFRRAPGVTPSVWGRGVG